MVRVRAIIVAAAAVHSPPRAQYSCDQPTPPSRSVAPVSCIFYVSIAIIEVNNRPAKKLLIRSLLIVIIYYIYEIDNLSFNLLKYYELFVKNNVPAQNHFKLKTDPNII